MSTHQLLNVIYDKDITRWQLMLNMETNLLFDRLRLRKLHAVPCV
jgi:hypothetical protein